MKELWKLTVADWKVEVLEVKLLNTREKVLPQKQSSDDLIKEKSINETHWNVTRLIISEARVLNCLRVEWFFNCEMKWDVKALEIAMIEWNQNEFNKLIRETSKRAETLIPIE